MGKVPLSNSSLFALQTCGEYFKRRYEDRDLRPGTLRMHRGGAVHEASREAHKRQVQAKRDRPGDPIRVVLAEAVPTEDEAASIASDAFDAKVREGVTVQSEDVAEAGSQQAAIGKAKDVSVAMAVFYNKDVAPGVNPVAFERRIDIRPLAADYELRGVLDLVEQSPETGEETILDLKTSERTPPKDSAAKSQQLTFYSLLRKAETGVLPSGAELRTVVRSPKSGEVKLATHRTVVTDGDLDAMIARIDVAVASIKAGIFVPAEPGHWKCSSRWCEFYANCRYALRRT